MQCLPTLPMMEMDAFAFKDCGNNWERRNDSCYKFIPDELSFKRAEEHCESLGAHLAEVGDGEENSFIQTLMWVCLRNSTIPKWTFWSIFTMNLTSIPLFWQRTQRCLAGSFEDFAWNKTKRFLVYQEQKALDLGIFQWAYLLFFLGFSWT